MTHGFYACYAAIMAARLPEPLVFPPFAVYFDTRRLDDIKDYYGADLFRECLAVAKKEVTA